MTDLIPPEELIASFNKNPHLPLISVKCQPYHYGSSVVIVGDAAHAMVPFYGQGMNAGLEDVRVLFSILDKHAALEDNHPTDTDTAVATETTTTTTEKTAAACKRRVALAEYTAIRVPDAHAINDLALENYIEMRASVLSRRYRLRKWLEEFMSVHVPRLGWQTKYSRVSFSNERYSEVVAKSDRQGRILVSAFEALVCSPFVVAAAVLWWKRPQTVVGAVRGALTWLLDALN